MIFNIVLIAVLIVIAICQVKQAFFPILYTPFEEVDPGVEAPKDTEIDENNPLFKMIMEGYAKANTFQRPSAYVQTVIEDNDNTGVEVITDKEEFENYK